MFSFILFTFSSGCVTYLIDLTAVDINMYAYAGDGFYDSSHGKPSHGMVPLLLNFFIAYRTYYYCCYVSNQASSLPFGGNEDNTELSKTISKLFDFDLDLITQSLK